MLARSRHLVVLLPAITVMAASAGAQAAPPAAVEVSAETRALITLPARDGATLTVTSPAFKSGGDIPFENTQYKGNIFPGLAWSAGPAGTKSYAVIMQDTDGKGRDGNPFLHWTMANVASSVTKLDAAMTTPPSGAMFGPNYKGANQPYLGPRTPAGPKHRYHLQVFALDTTLPAEAMATYQAVLSAMKDHVLASGEIVGLGQVLPPGGK
jgi:para-nitrobenzyl esterase